MGTFHFLKVFSVLILLLQGSPFKQFRLNNQVFKLRLTQCAVAFVNNLYNGKLNTAQWKVLTVYLEFLTNNWNSRSGVPPLIYKRTKLSKLLPRKMFTNLLSVNQSDGERFFYLLLFHKQGVMAICLCPIATDTLFTVHEPIFRRVPKSFRISFVFNRLMLGWRLNTVSQSQYRQINILTVNNTKLWEH